MATLVADKEKKRIMYLAILLVLLPVLAESIYSPMLPSLARSFAVDNHLAEHTMSIYLLGTALGTLLWGNMSDVLGRRSVSLFAYGLFLLATLFCFISKTYWVFMVGRLLQGFAGAVSCMSPCILRDVFTQKQRVEVSSVVGMVVSIAPALGALVGGVFALYGSWRMAFALLFVIGLVFFVRLVAALPETCQHRITFNWRSYQQGFRGIGHDKNLLVHAAMIGLGLGICYAFFAEGSFYFIDVLSISPHWFGIITALGAVVYAAGCRVANRIIQSGVPYAMVMQVGVMVMVSAFLGFSFLVYVHESRVYSLVFSVPVLSVLLTGFWVLAQFGLSFVLTPSFALALENQSQHAGIAASLFSFSYSSVNVVVSALMAFLHNGTLFVMPLYFLSISVLMMIVFVIAFNRRWLCSHNIADYSVFYHKTALMYGCTMAGVILCQLPVVLAVCYAPVFSGFY